MCQVNVSWRAGNSNLSLPFDHCVKIKVFRFTFPLHFTTLFEHETIWIQRYLIIIKLMLAGSFPHLGTG